MKFDTFYEIDYFLRLFSLAINSLLEEVTTNYVVGGK